MIPLISTFFTALNSAKQQGTQAVSVDPKVAVNTAPSVDNRHNGLLLALPDSLLSKKDS